MEGELLPVRPSQLRNAALLWRALQQRRNQQLLLPDALQRSAREVGRRGALGVRLRAQSAEKHHAPEATPSGRRRSGLLLEDRTVDGPKAGPDPLPAASVLQKGFASAARLRAVAAGRLPRRVRVSSLLLVRRGGLRRPAFGARCALCRRHRRAGGHAGSHHRVGIPSAAAHRLWRATAAKLGGTNPLSAVERRIRLLQARRRGHRAAACRPVQRAAAILTVACASVELAGKRGRASDHRENQRKPASTAEGESERATLLPGAAWPGRRNPPEWWCLRSWRAPQQCPEGAGA